MSFIPPASEFRRMTSAVRYPLEHVPFQQLQPLWPGVVLSVTGYPEPVLDGEVLVCNRPALELWCTHETAPTTTRAPVYGVWIIGDGEDKRFGSATLDVPGVSPGASGCWPTHVGTVDLCRDGAGVWHVFTGLVGYAAESPEPWTMPTKPFPGAHFACFPPELNQATLDFGTGGADAQ